jgi:hypothetical protein
MKNVVESAVSVENILKEKKCMPIIRFLGVKVEKQSLKIVKCSVENVI